MSRGTCNFFAQLTHFFKRHFGSSGSTSSSLNANVPSAGPPPTLQQSQLPQPSTSSTSQFVIGQVIPQPMEAPPCSVEHGALSSDLTTPPLGCDVPASPPDLTLQSPTSASSLTHPSPHPAALCAPMPRFGGPASSSFAGAHDFNLYNPQFNDLVLAGSGLKELLKNSMPGAFHDSAARYPPPKCHLGTRREYIAQVTDWALGTSSRNEPIFWMRGPFGVGKSAIAQSCAEILNSRGKLAATLFFSRSNSDRDDPQRVFTSIAFQIATKSELFRSIIDTRIREDPSLTTKSLSAQFNELLVRPLAQLDFAKSGIGGHVIIIDGLDECRGSPEQCEIIRVIAASARDRTTPFRWFITSRPEDPIIRTMKSPAVSPFSFHTELPVSRAIDHEILLYLTDEFNGIRESHSLADSWPPEEVLSLLVERAAGLWIYVTTIVRFIVDENSYGPEYQLRLVVQFVKNVSAKVVQDNPLAEMDLLYTLIMQRIPERIRKTVQDLLLIHSLTGWTSDVIVTTLGLSEDQVRRSCTFIQSVMELRGSNLGSMRFHFYHASFLDFMKDPTRSKKLCIYGDFLIEYRRECLDWLHKVCSCSAGPSDIKFPSESVLLEGLDRTWYYSNNLVYFWRLCGVPNHPFDLRTAVSLDMLPFQTMIRLLSNLRCIVFLEVEHINDNLPTEYRDKIIRNAKCPTPGCTNTKVVFIWGHGESETVSQCHSNGSLIFENNQAPRPGWCFCESQIQTDG